MGPRAANDTARAGRLPAGGAGGAYGACFGNFMNFGKFGAWMTFLSRFDPNLRWNSQSKTGRITYRLLLIRLPRVHRWETRSESRPLIQL